ncbi:MAG: FKBP-type peptidyl-prolyl cis-trans isomerase [Bacteroidales bacterium]|nr:FKBP-type peptidyl-prolyl cis-trans isomerase [Candidatus Hennigimonas equi]
MSIFAGYMNKKTTIYRSIAAISIAAALLGCARIGDVSDEKQDTKTAFDAWMAVHHPGIDTTANGIYILKDIPGTGEYVRDSNFLFIEYEQRSLEDSSIVGYTSVELAKQMGVYDETYCFDPLIFKMTRGACSQGLLDILKGGNKIDRMRIGGTRTAIVPGWLTSTATYYPAGNADLYVKNVTGTHYSYTIKVVNSVKDIIQWQIDSIETYMKHHNIEIEDTTGHRGFYYWRDRKREAERGVEVIDSVHIPSDSTYMINYVGRFLNGKVFDTNIKDTAKVWHLYDKSRKYEPVKVTCGADSLSYKLSGSSVIPGFSMTMHRMHPYESGRGLFTSNHGYDSQSSGTVNAYSPLIFEIDIVESK